MRLNANRSQDGGVTLVEMLVALSLFALVGIASFATLDAIVKARARTEGRLEAITAIDRTLLLFSRDLAQATPSEIRGDATMLLIGPQNATVSWVLMEGAVVRQREDLLRDLSGPDQHLISGVQTFQLRFLDAERTWFEAWPAETAPGALIGIELMLKTERVPGPIRRLVALAEDGL